ncbi:dTDP-4-dehydrorhamnose reductase [Bizionia sediminis]|uniref:dTDP-4-dehydrorhamnose reductase n=1 Tax=Bizionia sediminis TaxID=1737064 RepID=A0ABW5KT47_9FLAO
MIHILVTGGNGQLASCIKDLASNYKNVHITYTDAHTLDISDNKAVTQFFSKHTVNYCVNCAAYTAVDSAENEMITAKNVNQLGAKNLAIACQANQATLIHISTDFVFDGAQSTLYSEAHKPNPQSVYGKTKYQGEIEIQQHLKRYFILRTSWLYSEHGHNFMRTMLRLAKERDTLSIVSDQIGTPTYAKDLAEVILTLITTNQTAYGLYHYSNEGVASWYDFAQAIFQETQTTIKVIPIKTVAYPTPAKRPAFSVLDKTKIKDTFQISIPYWRTSLQKALKAL